MENRAETGKVKVIDSLWTFAVAVAIVGPGALPLLWRNPRFSVRTKWVGSLVVIGLTGWLLWFTKNQAVELMDAYNTMKAQGAAQ